MADALAIGGATVMINDLIDWFSDSANWHGEDGVPARLFEHLGYSFSAVLISLLIAVPLGLYIGHTGRGAGFVVGSVNTVRALPTVGLLYLVVLLLQAHLPVRFAYLAPAVLVLVVLGVPPVLSNTYAGVDGVDPEVRGAAYGMGMTGQQVLWRVEFPNALPLMFSGLRSAVLQVIATATIGAYVSLGGLGYLIREGQQTHNYTEMAAGAVLVALLAVAIDLILAACQRVAVSRGITGRYSRGALARRGAAPEEVAEDVDLTRIGATA
jgi:osmoprotectant transport system permease protein